MHEIDLVRLNFSPASLVALNFILAFVLFGVALDMKFEDFKGIKAAPLATLIGLLGQFVMLPAVAYLLEVLSEFQVTIPEIGTVKAVEPPIVIVTSNRTREIHDALKRRCLYHWVGYPDAARELEILRRKRPQAGEALARAASSCPASRVSSSLSAPAPPSASSRSRSCACVPENVSAPSWLETCLRSSSETATPCPAWTARWRSSAGSASISARQAAPPGSASTLSGDDSQAAW